MARNSMAHNSFWFMPIMLICCAEAYVHTIKKNTEALSVSCKEIGIEVNADKTKYMVMSQDQNAGRSRNIKIDSSSFEMVEDKYLGTTYVNQNSIQKEIKSRLKSWNAAIIRSKLFCFLLCYPKIQRLRYTEL